MGMENVPEQPIISQLAIYQSFLITVLDTVRISPSHCVKPVKVVKRVRILTYQ
jgi:hypothetical protein